MKVPTIVWLTLFSNLIVWGFGFETGQLLRSTPSIASIYPGRIGCFNGHFEIAYITFGVANLIAPSPLDLIRVAPCDQYNRFTQD